MAHNDAEVVAVQDSEVCRGFVPFTSLGAHPEPGTELGTGRAEGLTA